MAAPMPAALRDALFEAVQDGDIAALEACFQDPLVRAEIDDTERYIASNAVTTAVFSRRTDAGLACPWYFMLGAPQSKFNCKHLYALAVTTNRLDVVQWFFSSPWIELMPATLALMAQAAHQEANAEILEFLLGVGGSDLFPSGHRAEVLTKAMFISGAPNRAMVELVAAHGGEVYSEGLVRYMSWAADPPTLNVAIQNGAFVVGADVLCDCAMVGNADLARQLQRLGADGGTACNGLLQAATSGHMDVVEFFANEAFVDVDKRDRMGRTALMILTKHAPTDLRQGEHGLLSAAVALLRAGADPTLVDIEKQTALDHAKRSENAVLVDLFQKPSPV